MLSSINKYFKGRAVCTSYSMERKTVAKISVQMEYIFYFFPFSVTA